MGYPASPMPPTRVAGIAWNRWPVWPGISGRFGLESVAGFDWNKWPVYVGISGRIAPEYAGIANGIGFVGYKLGQLLIAAQQIEPAEQVLTLSRNAFVKLGQTPYVQAIDQLLAEHCSNDGNGDEAT